LPSTWKAVARAVAQERYFSETLFPELESLPVEVRSERSGTFTDNLSLPVHRWFRYPAGFSALWVRQLLQRECNRGRRRVLDPFCGTGTVLLEAEYAGLEAVGLEAHPFLVRVAEAKLHCEKRSPCCDELPPILLLWLGRCRQLPRSRLSCYSDVIGLRRSSG
jgi:hypothetical protein